MAASEKQKAALARARAARAAKVAAPVSDIATVVAAHESPLHDPTFAAYMAEEPPMPDVAPVLDPEIAFESAPAADSTLFDLATKYLKLTAVKAANGEPLDRCMLCDDLYEGFVIRGLHHTTPYRCECPCHPLRKLLDTMS